MAEVWWLKHGKSGATGSNRVSCEYFLYHTSRKDYSLDELHKLYLNTPRKIDEPYFDRDPPKKVRDTFIDEETGSPVKALYNTNHACYARFSRNYKDFYEKYRLRPNRMVTRMTHAGKTHAPYFAEKRGYVTRSEIRTYFQSSKELGLLPSNYNIRKWLTTEDSVFHIGKYNLPMLYLMLSQLRHVNEYSKIPQIFTWLVNEAPDIDPWVAHIIANYAGGAGCGHSYHDNTYTRTASGYSYRYVPDPVGIYYAAHQLRKAVTTQFAHEGRKPIRLLKLTGQDEKTCLDVAWSCQSGIRRAPLQLTKTKFFTKHAAVKLKDLKTIKLGDY